MSNTMMTLKDLHAAFPGLKSTEVILDVRRPDEFSEGHIKNALNIPVDEVAARASELKNYERVFIHCKRGGRAKTAFEALKAQGLNNLVCIHDAGMDGWIDQGYPVERT